MAKTTKLEVAPVSAVSAPLVKEFSIRKGGSPSRMVLRGDAAGAMVKSLGIEAPSDVTLGTVVCSNAVQVDSKGVVLPVAFTVYGRKSGSQRLANALESLKSAYAGKNTAPVAKV